MRKKITYIFVFLVLTWYAACLINRHRNAPEKMDKETERVLMNPYKFMKKDTVK